MAKPVSRANGKLPTKGSGLFEGQDGKTNNF
jgi:hypothetical protein